MRSGKKTPARLSVHCCESNSCSGQSQCGRGTLLQGGLCPRGGIPRVPHAQGAREEKGSRRCRADMAEDFYTNMHDEDLYDEAYTTQAKLLERPARTPHVPAKKSRAAKAKTRGQVINLPGQRLEIHPPQQEDLANLCLKRPRQGAAFHRHRLAEPKLIRSSRLLLTLLSRRLRGNRPRLIQTQTLTPPSITRIRAFRPRMHFSLCPKVNLFLTFLFQVMNLLKIS